MGPGGVFSSLLSFAAKFVPGVSESMQAPQQYSSSLPTRGHQIGVELTELTRMLELIKAQLYAVEGRKVIDSSSKLWLKEVRQVAYDAEDVLDEYNYEALRAQIESRDDYPGRKLVQP